MTATRLGVIAPPTNTVNEKEWAQLLPEGVSMHFTRMALHADTDTSAGKQALHDDLAAAMTLLRDQGANVMVYACTAGSMTLPHHALPDWMRDTAGMPAVTTAAAIVDALRDLKVHRVAVATPYHDALNRHETHFLEHAGFDVLACEGLGIGANGPHEYVQIARVDPSVIAAHVRSVYREGADALLMSCTDFPTLGLIDELEQEFGIPVLSSNTATLWAALRAGHACAPARGGQLFNPRNQA
jgi:maleate cis-trans isomerase